ncbi:MAG: glycoside hydrolase family 16 protein [Janthinobacterium lividum]
MRRLLPRPVVVTTALLVVLGGWTTGAPASAAAPLSQVSLNVVVSGSSVAATAVIKAGTARTVDEYFVCVRDGQQKIVDFSPKLLDVTISSAGSTYTGRRTFPEGTYRYYPCVHDDGAWTRVGDAKSFTVEAPAAADPKIVFQDDFSGAKGQPFDSSRWGEWSACTYNGSAAYGNIDCGADETLDGQGHLQIPADPTHGSSISTKDEFTFVYGEVSAWVKTPPQVGYWPAFWTLNNNANGVDSLPLGEADVLESYTTWPTIYHRGTHNWNNSLTWGSPGDPYCGNVDLGAAFHKYTARFEPGKITFFFDDVRCGDVTTQADGNGKPYGFGPDVTRGNWLLLTLAVGGAGGQQKPATDAATMLVDRVEVRTL